MFAIIVLFFWRNFFFEKRPKILVVVGHFSACVITNILPTKPLSNPTVLFLLCIGSYDEAGETDPDARKREDMDKVIRELTRAVMKSKNVTTLTRAMKNKHDDANSSTGSSKRRSFRRNPLRSSIRTLRSLSRSSKGVDAMKNLWQQTGMKTNGGRRLLVDSSGSEDSAPYRSVLVVSRTMSGDSQTTATYAEVYQKTDADSTSSNESNRKTVKFRADVRNPKFVHDRRKLLREDIIINVNDLQSSNDNHKSSNYWETYYGTVTAPENRPNTSRLASGTNKSLYNTPYYDYRRENSKVKK